MKNNPVTKIVVLISCLLGLVFASAIRTDIQLGFAAVLISQAVVNWTILKRLEK